MKKRMILIAAMSILSIALALAVPAPAMADACDTHECHNWIGCSIIGCFSGCVGATCKNPGV